jgi:hypothetical protein
MMGLQALAVASGELERACGERNDYAAALLEVRRLVREAEPNLARWCARLTAKP